MRRIALLGVAIAVVGASCAPDPLDTYSVQDEEAPPATRAPLPTTTTTEPVAESVGESVEPEPDPTYGPNGESVDVRSLDNSFIQQQIEIEAGTEVNWINGGRNDHNILPVDESLTWGVDRDTFVPGTEYAHVFDTPGVYPYFCSIHGTTEAGMVGAIVVTEPT
ncbi:MAG: plastocyanin/azurin family copper-binding protein [Ilumatobacter sp.]|uniref:cupredoxin domain-containing protein n=1 Tax=Ilumatobacter sp. TaxID=1967498 RepID=UPI003C76DFAC